MKISLEWISEYLPGPPVDPQAAAEALTNAGLPVEVIETVGQDTVIDVEVTSNRGDCLSHAGVARELSAMLNRPFKELVPAATESQVSAATVTKAAIEVRELCPHYTARIIRGVKIGPSPAWMQRRLQAVGLRPINNIVDVTNYVLFELGQPLHAFDFDKLAGQEIIVRTARPGETITSIDGHQRKLAPDMLVIADRDRPVAIAGVMGGRDNEVSDSTVNVLLESARFDPLSVRKTSRALALKSDSSYRFERGIDPALPIRASLRAAQLILETSGGELLSGIVEAGSGATQPKKLSLRLPRLQQVLGVAMPVESVMDAFARLRLPAALNGDRIDVIIPSFRLDLNIETDLIEEVARLVGYDKIPVRDEISIKLTPPDPANRTIQKIRDALTAGGYFEAVTFSFVSDALAGDFNPAEAAALPRADSAVRKADANLRPSIIPGLLEAVRRNEANGVPDARLFEIGSTFWSDAGGAIQERQRIGLVGSHNVREVRGVIESLLSALDNELEVKVIPGERRGLAPGAAGRIEWGGKAIGYLGMVSHSITEKLGLRQAPVAAEIEMNALLSGAQHVPQLHPLPRFPAIRRDLSLIVSDSVAYSQIDSTIRQTQPANLEGIEYVTTYRGKPLEKGSKSVTVTLIFRSATETLTSEQVESAVERVIQSAKDRIGAALRT